MRRVLVLIGLALVLRLPCRDAPGAIRIATFNIEDFPKDARQIDGAFAEIAKLDAPIVGVEEIMDQARFAREATARLGDRWRVVFEPFVDLTYRHNGVLFDRDAFALVSTAIHDETRLGGDNKAVLEVRLRPRDGGAVIRVLVVHLKCCTEGREVRVRQHAALAKIVRAASHSGDRIVVLGDFNATEAGDRRDLAALATTANLHWGTESLACTAFWSRDDGCPRSRLDHVLAWSAGEPHAFGACATEGCDWQPACPLYTEQVSDHCPVAVDLR
jgi:endonuclease/exonuclease/phosphatase family metal-dependent hydrolase